MIQTNAIVVKVTYNKKSDKGKTKSASLVIIFCPTLERGEQRNINNPLQRVNFNCDWTGDLPAVTLAHKEIGSR
mgnify:FL=1